MVKRIIRSGNEEFSERILKRSDRLEKAVRLAVENLETLAEALDNGTATRTEFLEAKSTLTDIHNDHIQPINSLLSLIGERLPRK